VIEILNVVPDAAAGSSSSAVIPVPHEACQRAALSSDGAKLLRLRESAIGQLATDQWWSESPGLSTGSAR
jgi:hypothetical protein